MRAALSTLLLVTLAACGSSAGAPEDAATYEPNGEGGNAALLKGTIIHEGDCFYLDTTEGERFLPIFPADSVETSQSTLTYAGTAFEPGEGIALSGGETPRTADIAEAASVPSGCDQDVALWVVSQTG